MIVYNLKPKGSIFCFVSDNFRQLGGVEGGMSEWKLFLCQMNIDDKSCLRVKKEERKDCTVAEQAAWHLFCTTETLKVLKN